jgi:hypothetical protein
MSYTEPMLSSGKTCFTAGLIFEITRISEYIVQINKGKNKRLGTRFTHFLLVCHNCPGVCILNL